MANWTVLAIDDDPKILTLVKTYLEEESYSVLTAANGRDALSVLQAGKPDVILLDMLLPDLNGLTLMGELRKRTGAPVIVVSGKGDETDRVIGLEMGADDYITKPFSLRELTARIKSVMRRVSNPEEKSDNAEQSERSPQVLEFNGWRMDCARYEVVDPANKPVDLTTGEFKLLQVLVNSSNRALSRDHLFDVTRGEDYDSFDRAVDIQINRLRRKLGDDPKSPELIKTVRGIGYMFIGDVKKAS